MGKLSNYHLHDSLGYQISLASRLQEKRFEESLKSVGLTRIFWCVLLAVGNEGLTQPSEIADFIGIDRTATSRALRQMEERGLIRRTSGQEDKRTTLVHLTDDGVDALHHGEPCANSNNAYMAAKLTETELKEISRLLQKLSAGETTGLKTI